MAHAPLEDRLEALLSDRARVARWFQIASWISTGMVVLGIVIGALVLMGVLRF